MQKCLGLLGKIFGHSFKNYLMESRGADISEALAGTEDYKGTLYGYKEIMDKKIEMLKLAKKSIYQVRCKRCGLKPIGGVEAQEDL